MEFASMVFLPTRVDDGGGQGETGHGRDSNGYPDIGRGRRWRPETSAPDDRAAAPPTGTAATSFDEQDPSATVAATDAGLEQEHQRRSNSQRNHSPALLLRQSEYPQYHHRLETSPFLPQLSVPLTHSLSILQWHPCKLLLSSSHGRE